MTGRLKFCIDWERLERGSPEDRATYGALGILCDGFWLTEAQDHFIKSVREKVHLSGYRFALWLAWNWWRLRWEARPGKRDLNWEMSHRTTTVGGGYVWPNITLTSDGSHVLLEAHPTRPTDSEPLRYLSDRQTYISANEFETAVDDFISLVIGKLKAEGIGTCDLQSVWESVREERRDPDMRWYRRLEAQMGCDPDEGPEETIERLIDEAALLGHNGVTELASILPPDPEKRVILDHHDVVTRVGLQLDLSHLDAQRNDLGLNGSGELAWQVGVAAAQAFRRGQGLGDNPVGNKTLAELAGASIRNFVGANTVSFPPYSFSLTSASDGTRAVLHSLYETNRRFAVARIIGDYLLMGNAEPFIPVLKSKTYRQKLQRAFAAELLCPFDALRDFLSTGDDEDAQQKAAEYFSVSPITIQTLLVNNGYADRDSLQDF